ncbi:hypothetical protein ABIF99_010771 [Bradyrhizobium japonicum]
MRCTASAEPAASRWSASIFLVISSVAPWVCTASAFTSVATTAKPLPAAPARAASMVELSASSVVCRAIWAIRLTTLPMAAEDSRRRSTLARASCAAALASSASLPASRTCAPMPCADWVNLSAAWAKVEAVDCAALVRPVRASVRSRISASVAAVASRRRPLNWRRARAGGSWRRARVPAVPGFPGRSRLRPTGQARDRPATARPVGVLRARTSRADASGTMRTPSGHSCRGTGGCYFRKPE